MHVVTWRCSLKYHCCGSVFTLLSKKRLIKEVATLRAPVPDKVWITATYGNKLWLVRGLLLFMKRLQKNERLDVNQKLQVRFKIPPKVKTVITQLIIVTIYPNYYSVASVLWVVRAVWRSRESTLYLIILDEGVVLAHEKLGSSFGKFRDTADSSILVIGLALKNFRLRLSTLKMSTQAQIWYKIECRIFF